MVSIEDFAQRATALKKHLTDLQETATALPWIPSDLLPQAFKEISSNSKMLKLAIEELYIQNQELIQTRHLLETERQRYFELFEFAPDAYLVTDANGVIEEANCAAAALLKISQDFLIGKPLINFVEIEQHERFRFFLIELSKYDIIKELIIPLRLQNGESLNTIFKLAVVRNQQSKPLALRWLVREISEDKKSESGTFLNDNNLSENRQISKYCRGETIALNPLIIYYVRQGLVKLSTFCESGEEVLIGLATEGMVFGSSMTSLSTYQTTALSDVDLVSIYLTEIPTNSFLIHTLLPKINQRLRQTESFLAIAGRRRIQERLHHLLLLLKQEIGQPVADGTRISVRLTHEELAGACCTTRVTITRLMGKFQKQGLISFDSKNHIILKHKN